MEPDENKVKYVKVLLKDYSMDPRDTREIDTALSMGYDVVLFCTHMVAMYESIKNRIQIIEQPFPEELVKCSRFIRLLKILWYWNRTARRIADLRPDCISGHDYLALLVAYFAKKKCGRWDVKLIYDSHEFELGRKKRGYLSSMLVKSVEGFLIRRCDATMVVSDLIGQELQKMYHPRVMPTVIRNVPTTWHVDVEQTRNTRRKYLNHFQNDAAFILICHGLIFPVYGLEYVIEEIREIENCCLVILGNENGDGYLNSLKSMVTRLRMEKRVLFLPAVPYAELGYHIAAADLGAILIRHTIKNGYFASPNKFFECIQAGIPMVTSTSPSMKLILEHYGIGISVNPEEREAVSQAVRMMMLDGAMYSECKAKMAVAKKELCWEQERSNLIEMLDRVLQRS